MIEEIKKTIDAMTTDEMKQRLTEYMAADQQLIPRPVAVEVRPSVANSSRCRYDVLFINENGQETEVKFHDRYSRLLYIYTHKAISVVWQLPTTIRNCNNSTACSISRIVMLW